MRDQEPNAHSLGPNATRRRAAAGAFVIFGLFGILIARLTSLHLTNGAELQRMASRQRVVREEVLPRPGDIVDRKGRLLATSIEVRSLFIAPKKLKQPRETADTLANILQLNPTTLWQRVEANADKGFLWVKRRVSDEEANQVRALKLPTDSWGFRTEYRRFYPQPGCAPQVVGLRDIDGNGRGGIEASRDSLLRGATGKRELLQDARGHVLQVLTDAGHPVRHGETVTLTLDAYLQLHAEKVLDEVLAEWKPKTACALVLDPENGDILAMASRPTYNPEHPELAPPDGWTNRAINDQYEPGSTFKPVVVAWAIDHGLITQDEVFHCENGEWRMGGRVLHDHHRYGPLNVADILAKSSNIGMAKIGERLTNARLYDAAMAFGFGRRTGVELPGESTGIVWPLRKWTRYSTGSVPMGQELTATPLQMATAFAVFANGGRLVSPHIIQHGPESSGQAPVVTQVIPPETAEWLRRGPLVDVVSKGTGKKAAIPGYEVFGKTGTAQKVDPQTGQYSRALHVSSFVCGAPADKPRAIVLVSVDEPSVTVNGEHFGGSVAAPAAGHLLRRVLEYYHVPPGPSKSKPAAVASEDRFEQSPILSR